MATCWFPDNSVIINFAVVDRLDLLRSSLRGQGRVVEAVHYEIGQSQSRVPNLHKLDREDWFGEAIRIDDEHAQQAVESMRKIRFGGEDSKPREHLGESQTLHVLRTDPEYSGSVWITEDRGAFRVAKAMGLIARDTRDLLEELVAFGELAAQAAFEIAVQMDRAGRPLMRMPTTVRDLEP
jgi:predicted nucleic acid-binding protein